MPVASAAPWNVLNAREECPGGNVTWVLQNGNTITTNIDTIAAMLGYGDSGQRLAEMRPRAGRRDGRNRLWPPRQRPGFVLRNDNNLSAMARPPVPRADQQQNQQSQQNRGGNPCSPVPSAVPSASDTSYIRQNILGNPNSQNTTIQTSTQDTTQQDGHNNDNNNTMFRFGNGNPQSALTGVAGVIAPGADENQPSTSAAVGEVYVWEYHPPTSIGDAHKKTDNKMDKVLSEISGNTQKTVAIGGADDTFAKQVEENKAVISDTSATGDTTADASVSDWLGRTPTPNGGSDYEGNLHSQYRIGASSSSPSPFFPITTC